MPASDALDDVRTYRPFIDGLRAVAILTVVGCHVGVPGFAGGYVGVDFFFVISGYLIIGQIDSDIARGRFSLLDFAARRALRILPAFLLVMATCLVLVTTVFVQFNYEDFAWSFFQSAIMLANHYFLSHQGYFEMAAFTKPLLHMWSLSVEEQFYLVAPLSLVGLYAATRRLAEPTAKRARLAIAALLALASFVACIALTYGVAHNAAFYVMPARGWEFILGGMAPDLVRVLRRHSAGVTAATAVAGAAAIVYAVVSFDAATYYPTFRAAFPAVGTMLLIASGIAMPGNAVARVLATPPMVAIGLVSYPWYLWHWPLLSFLRTSDFTEHGIGKALAVAALSLVLAALTYWLLERPIREWRRAHKPRNGPVLAAMLTGCVALGAFGYGFSLYAAPRLLPEVAGLAPLPRSNTPDPPVAHRGLLVGDSHAMVAAPTLEMFARRAGAAWTVTTYPSCPPLLHVDIRSPYGERITNCKAMFAGIDYAGAEFMIVMARWNFYLGLPWSDPYYVTYDVIAEQGAANEAPIALMGRGLGALLAAAKQRGVRRILVIGPTPEFPVHAPYCLVRALRLGAGNCTIDRASVDARRAAAMEMLRQVVGNVEGARLIDPIGVFCDATTCRPNDGRTLYFFDSNHMSPTGLERFYNAFANDFRWAFTGEQADAAVIPGPERSEGARNP